MRIIARRTLREFVAEHAGHDDERALKAAIDSWFADVSKATWTSTADVIRLYATASIVSADRIVFNIIRAMTIAWLLLTTSRRRLCG